MLELLPLRFCISSKQELGHQIWVLLCVPLFTPCRYTQSNCTAHFRKIEDIANEIAILLLKNFTF